MVFSVYNLVVPTESVYYFNQLKILRSKGRDILFLLSSIALWMDIFKFLFTNRVPSFSKS